MGHLFNFGDEAWGCFSAYSCEIYEAGGIYSELSRFGVGHDGFPFYCLRKSEEGVKSKTIVPALLA